MVIGDDKRPKNMKTNPFSLNMVLYRLCMLTKCCFHSDRMSTFPIVPKADFHKGAFTAASALIAMLDYHSIHVYFSV